MAAQIIIQLLLFLLTVSGPAVCCAFWKKSFERVLPVSCALLVLLLFAAGLAGLLRAGVRIALLLCIAAYIAAFCRIWRDRSFSEFAGRFFTPGFAVFAFSFAALTYADFGRPMAGWDEFSHWGDIVKVMTASDAFGTAEGSGALFQSYPPGMSLFQYFFQRISLAIAPDGGFCEWRLFFAYQIFFIAYILQFLDGYSFRQAARFVPAAAVLLLAPTVYFSECYAEIYIDPFIGVVSGASLALIFTHSEHDRLYSMNILTAIAVLVLSKDAGMLFALFVLAAYIGDAVIRSRQDRAKVTLQQRLRALAVPVLSGIAALLLPKLLWSLNLHASGAEKKFSGEIDAAVLFDVIAGRDTGFHAQVWHNFWQRLASDTVRFGTFSIRLPYLLVIAASIAAVWGIMYLLQRSSKSRLQYSLLAAGTLAAQLAVYIFGLCVIYMFKFTEHEALELTSWSRYIFIACLSCWMFIAAALTELLRQAKIKPLAAAAVMLCIIAVFVPLRRTASLALRNGLEDAVEFRAERQPLVDTVLGVIGDEHSARITVISQESTGFDYIFMHYSLRPCQVSGNWSLGEPFYEGDHWTVSITAGEWQAMLAESYDYVVICQLNSSFTEDFASVFENAQDIRSQAVYSVSDSGKLELCAAVPQSQPQ